MITSLVVTLTTRLGSIGTREHSLKTTSRFGNIGANEHTTIKFGSPMTWDRIPDDDLETALATFKKIIDGKVVGEVNISGDLWRKLDSEGDLYEAVSDIVSGSDIEDALRGQIDDLLIEYEHCGTEWEDRHSCACDSECPCCGNDIGATDSTMISGMADSPDDNGVFQLEENLFPGEALEEAEAPAP